MMWRRLGFGIRTAPRFDRQEEGFSPGYMLVTVEVHLSWCERLRVFVSGHVLLATASLTDVTVAKAKSKSVFSVLPPGYKFAKSQE